MGTFHNFALSCVFLIFSKLASGEVSPKIVGGSYAKTGEFPYHVALLRKDGSLACSGSIISPRWILTAGHCLTKFHPYELDVLAGTNDFTSGGVKYSPHTFIVHSNRAKNDIGLIKLKRPISFLNQNSSIEIVHLTMMDTLRNTGVTFAGWGRTGLNEADSNWLKKYNSLTTTNAFCKKRLGAHPDHNQPSPNNICVFTKPGEGICNGDSGGALINKFTRQQVGIASFSIDCGTGEPDVFTNVFDYRDWILKYQVLH